MVAKNNNKYRWMLLGLLLSIGLLGGIGVYFFKNQTSSSQVASITERIKSWMASHRHPLQDGLVRVKELTQKENDEDQPIHFEFYNALPAMQTPVTAPVTVTNAAAPKPKSIAPEVKPAVESDVAKPVVVSKNTRLKSTPPSIINSNELEQELSAQLQHTNYMIQLGMFKNPAIAERYRVTLERAGIAARMVKVIIAKKELFRIQLGPYATKEEAKGMQRQLNAKGINGIIFKS